MSTERMKKQKEDTLRKILDVAWEIAIRDGLESVSVRKIAAAMNFAPNNLYNYFKDKNELLLCLRKDAYQWTLDVFSNSRPQNADFRSMMENISKDLLHVALKEPQRYVVMTSEKILDFNEPMDTQINDHVADMIKKGIDNGEFRQVEPVTTAINIRMMIIGFIRMVSSNTSITIDQADTMLQNLMGILFDGIAKEKKND